ncbi:hypothetical protein LSCM1_03778 [Leishmania martiniquensis]|uniref:Actin-like protein n=1 Tax=Leishmania martiniquensis TaxID=1580590 RepID=A0A836GF32_9TRYP|nr:hypothetical protein LSCM1_03778 [Leishmania martiniquensis]
MSDDPPALVVYAGQMATYLCDGGDVQPTYPVEHPITEDVLRLLRQEQHQSEVADPRASASASAATDMSGDRASRARQRAQEIRSRIFPLMQGRYVVLVVPLSSTASYREEWTRLCFDGHVLARQLVMLTDTVASAFACGMDSGIVVHASLATVSMCRVEAGCSTRYSSSRMGSVQMLCGPKLSLQLTGEWPRAAFSVAASNSISMPALEHANDGEVTAASEGGASHYLAGSGVCGLADLTSPEYRDALIRVFGFKAYSAVIVHAQMASQQRQIEAVASSEGKGKSTGSQRSPSLLAELHQTYPGAVRRAPGQLEKLLVRVVQGAPTTPTSAARREGREPCVLAGEALAIPYVRELFDFVVRHCGDDVWAEVERERRARKRSSIAGRLHQCHSPSQQEGQGGTQGTVELEAARCAIKGGSTEAATCTRRQSSSSGSSTSGDKDFCEEDEEVEGESSSSSVTSRSSSMSSSSEDSVEDAWLQSQPTPLPTAPWWIPLLGGSIVSRITYKDVQRAVITAEEARETNGTVVHWKMLL